MEPLSITSGNGWHCHIVLIIFLPHIRLSKAGTESEMTEIYEGDILRYYQEQIEWNKKYILQEQFQIFICQRFGSDVVDKSRSVTQKCVIMKVKFQALVPIPVQNPKDPIGTQYSTQHNALITIASHTFILGFTNFCFTILIHQVTLQHPDGRDQTSRPSSSRLYRPSDSLEDLSVVTSNLQVILASYWSLEVTWPE